MRQNGKTNDEEYNGWTNYETWNAALWMDNDDTYWDERASEVAEEAENDKAATYDLAEILREHLRENAPEIGGFYGDVLVRAIERVNTYEIAKNLIDEYRRGAIREQMLDAALSEEAPETPHEQGGPSL